MEHNVEGANVKPVLVARTVLNGLLAVVLFGLPLFLSAGSLRFWNGWLFLAVFVISYLSITLYLSLTNPEYAQTRFKAAEQERTQRIVMSLLILCTLTILAISGLDYRFHWSKVPIQLTVIFTLVMADAFVMLFFVMKENSYASRVVEVQENQRVIDAGAYSVVRHPMYLSASIILCVSPFVLGSLYSLIPAFCTPLLLIFRIRNEEKVLLASLSGYDLYMKKVKYRLIPFIW